MAFVVDEFILISIAIKRRIMGSPVSCISNDSSVQRPVVLSGDQGAVVGVNIRCGDPAGDPREFVTGSAEQDSLSSFGGQKRFDAVKQMIRVGR